MKFYCLSDNFVFFKTCGELLIKYELVDICVKDEFLQESIFFLIHLFARDVLVMKKLEMEKTKPTFIISVSKVEY